MRNIHKFVSSTLSVALILAFALAVITPPTVAIATTSNPLISAEEWNTYTFNNLPTDPEGLKTYLVESASNDFGDDVFQNAAQSILSRYQTEAERARAAYDYVLANMTYVETISDNTASQALKNSRGNCTNYVIVTKALMNAIGLPTAYVIVKTESINVLFTFEDIVNDDSDHVIPFVFYNDNWHIMEPTWGDIGSEFRPSGSSADICFDFSIQEASKYYWFYAILSDRAHSQSSSSGSFSFSPYQLKVNGQTAQGFKIAELNGNYYFEVRDFALTLAQHAENRVYTFGYSGKYYFTYPGIANRDSNSFNYEVQSGSIGTIHLGLGAFMTEVPAIRTANNSRIYLSASNLCSLLGIKMIIDMNGQTIVVDATDLTTKNDPLKGSDDWARTELELALAAGIVPDVVAITGWKGNTSRLAVAESIVTIIEAVTGQTMSEIAGMHGWDLNTNTFSDTSSRFATFLRYAGVTSGTGDNQYSPNATIIRAEIVTMIGRTAEVFFGATMQGSNPFTDVPSWAAPYIGYAVEKNITNGVSTTSFDSGGLLQNQQTAIFVYRAYLAWR